jgi:t-SNARE complex subunit (syntaxin)
MQLQEPLAREALRQNNAIIEDNERAMHHIAEEVEGLNDLFLSLGTIVSQGHDEVETIASHAAKSAEHSSRAVAELERFHETQSGGCTLQ